VNTLRRAIEILDYLVSSPGDVSVSDVARKFKMSVSNAYKYLRVFEEYGFVTRKRDKKYVPGYKLAEYGAMVLRKIDLREIAHPYLVDVMSKTGQTVHLVIKDGLEGVYIDKVEGVYSIPMVSRVGMKIQLYSAASGKAILAHLPKEELEEYLSMVRLERKTPNTITDPEKLKEELRKIRELGYAIDNEENEVGIRCIGVPIFDHNGYPVAGMSVSGAAQRLTGKLIEDCISALKSAAEEISKKLGY